MGGKTKALYDERVKKGMVQIKVAFNIWMQKNKWVWLESHPDELNTYDPKKDIFIFLDGDRKNFDPHNIEKVTRGILGIINGHFGGIPAGSNPADTRLKIARAKLLNAQLDASERTGDIVFYTKKNNTVCRRRKTAVMAYYQKRKENRTEEEKEKIRKRSREWMRKYNKTHPLTPEQREKKNRHQREVYRLRMQDPAYREKRRAYNKAAWEKVKKKELEKLADKD